MATAVANGDAAVRRDSPTVRLSWAWREMRRGAATGVLVERLFGRPGEPDSIEPGHLDVLDLLAKQDGRRMSELAAALRVDPSTVTRTMHRMEAAGLARRAGTESDGRVVTAHLTDEGRRLHALVAARRAAIVEAGLHDFTPDEQEQLVGLLERFLAAVEQHVSATGHAAPG
jgi:DNA-binding MarR family transcriptional regulator